MCARTLSRLKYFPPPSDNPIDDKGKPVARRGRKATGLTEAAGLPKGVDVRRIFVALFVSMVGATMMAGVAQAGVMDFTDDFDTFDETRWSEGNHKLGRSNLDPANVSVSGGNLGIKLPARTTNVGEISSDELYGHGYYTALKKLLN